MDITADYRQLTQPERRALRERYVALQDGNCRHCGKPLTGEPAEAVVAMPILERLFPPNFFKWPVHLHHNHDTGMTIGAVHARCNAVLWQYHGE